MTDEQATCGVAAAHLCDECSPVLRSLKQPLADYMRSRGDEQPFTLRMEVESG